MTPIPLFFSPMETCPLFTVPNSEGEQEPVALILAAISIPVLSIGRLGIYSFPLSRSILWQEPRTISTFSAVIKQKTREGKIDRFRSLVTSISG